MHLFDGFRERGNLKRLITERERDRASRIRLNIIKANEKAMLKQADTLRKEFDRELNDKLREKDNEIRLLKKLIFSIKSSAEDIQVMGSEFELELRAANVMIGKFQNRFANIEGRAFREIQKIEKKVDKFIEVG